MGEEKNSPTTGIVELLENLKNQVALLNSWNQENINLDPEQVRKNIETLQNAILLFSRVS